VTGRVGLPAYFHFQPTPAFTLGESVAAGEIPYEGDIVVEDDPTHIYNTINVANAGAGGSSTTTNVSVLDSTSQVQYFPRQLDRSVNLNSDVTALDAAKWLLASYKDPHPRASRITVQASSKPQALPTLLGAWFSTRVQVNRRPPGPAAQIGIPAWLEKVTWTGDDQGALTWTGELSPAPSNAWWVVAAQHVTLTAGVSAGATSITVTPLMGSASNPAKATLPIGTHLVVGYGTSVQETVTVTSVAATSPGYTSVALGVTALANAHASGVMVTEPLGSGYTLPGATVFPTGLDACATLTATAPRVAY